ncbi:alanine racemase [Alkalibacillus filiformis]|uniref:Alanine racemase n=1 Tax=Alkalibacillus filiformis TaxID=200990 RepID=A0ABU0DWY0_9BACI|nr:alanine racemase [Alkalibacillus filiformis]MDQ0352973.1 alanine racemase [Alkalibacillus filiformis]
MVQQFYRDTWAEVDLNAIKYNVKQIKKVYPLPKSVYAVVKANAYGHGDVQVAKAALEAGADKLAVALLDEGLRLRESFPNVPILVLGRIRPSDAQIAADHDLTVTVFQKEWVMEASKHLTSKLNIHIKFDTGMNRLGIRTKEEAYDVLKELKSTTMVVTGIYSHLATADENNEPHLAKQFELFKESVKLLQDNVPNKIEVHLGNSAGAMRFPDSMYDAVRFGIGMYGLYPSQLVKLETGIPLKPAFSLMSQLTHVKKINKGDTISYGATYTAEEDEWIGTVPLGYGDGWIRKLQGFHVLIDGKKYPIVGRICMDQFMVKLDQPKPIDTKVVIIGEYGDETVSTDDVATHLETINYEIPCMINERVPRVYID